jgi:RNA polymerase sporulation-specific sigma factor
VDTEQSLAAPNLPHDEVRRLLRAAQAGDTLARATLIKANLRLARSVARRFGSRYADSDDLFQVACVGLIKAIDHFDLAFEVRFSTYAVPRILGEIQRYLQQDRPLKVGRSLQDTAAAATQARERLTQELGRSPTVREIAGHLGVDREDVVVALEAVGAPASLEQVIHQDDGEPILLRDHLGAEEGEVPDMLDNMALHQVLSSLSNEERGLVTMRFFRKMRQVEVAQAMQVSQAHVSRLERKVLRKMRVLLT